VTLQGEGHVPLKKMCHVHGNLGDEEWDDSVEVNIDFKLSSQDNYTYFPEYIVYASFIIDGAGSGDIADHMDVDVAFTEKDFNDNIKATEAAKRITASVNDHIETKYSDFVNTNASAIEDYKNHYGHDDYNSRPDR
jgi:hypothetical protein